MDMREKFDNKLGLLFALSRDAVVGTLDGTILFTNPAADELLGGGAAGQPVEALLPGLAIMPAVFAFGFEPTAGPGLIFQTLPAVFADMPLGRGFALLFFVLVFFAAATSAIALMEVVASFCIDTLHWSRRRATLLPTVLMAAIGVVASLSMGPLSGWTVGGMNLFDALGFLTDKLLLPVSALCMTIFIGHVWGVDAAAEEIAIGAARGFRLKKAYGFLMRWVAPALIAVIFVMGLVQG